MTDWYHIRLPNVEEIANRLRDIFQAGEDDSARTPAAARTVYVALYGGAMQREHMWLRPHTVCAMSEARAAEGVAQPWSHRREWMAYHNRPKRDAIDEHYGGEQAWLAENSREDIGRHALPALERTGAVIQRTGIATHSSEPRWALADDFANLFDPDLSGEKLAQAISDWQRRHFDAAALARIAARRGRVGAGENVLVPMDPLHPDTTTTFALRTDDSSELVRAVVGEFAPRFLRQPVVVSIGHGLWAGEAWPEEYAHRLGLLPSGLAEVDLVLIDLADGLVVFVEACVTGGPVDERRKTEIIAGQTGARFEPNRFAFVTAFLDRSERIFRQESARLAWGSFAWFKSEPHAIVHFNSYPPGLKPCTPISDLLRITRG